MSTTEGGKVGSFQAVLAGRREGCGCGARGCARDGGSQGSEMQAKGVVEDRPETGRWQWAVETVGVRELVDNEVVRACCVRAV